MSGDGKELWFVSAEERVLSLALNADANAVAVDVPGEPAAAPAEPPQITPEPAPSSP